MAQVETLLFILLFSILGGVLATRFKQPSVIGVLLAGALVGPHALDLVNDTEITHLAIEVGAILLLFVVGIEFSVKKLINLGIKPVLVAVVKLGLMFLLGYHAALLFRLDLLTALFLGVIVSITSTVVFLKILEQKGLSGRPEVALLVAVLIIEDIFGVFALTLFSALSTDVALEPLQMIARLLTAFGLLFIVYLVLLRVAKPIMRWFSKYSTEDVIPFIAIGLCAGMSYFAYRMDLSAAIGAFLAGNIVSSLDNKDVFEKAVHPFILAFTSLFFFAIGTIVDIPGLAAVWWLVLAFFLVNTVGKFIVVGLSSFLLTKTDGKGAVFSGLAMLSLGEFSLLIAQEGNKLGLSLDLVSFTAAIIFLSSLSMSLAVSHHERFHKAVIRATPGGLRGDLKTVESFLRCFSLKETFSRLRLRRISTEWKSIRADLIGMLFIIFLVGVWYHVTEFRFISLILGSNALLAVIGVAALALLFPTFSLVRSFRDMVVDLFREFLKLYPSEVANEKKLFRNLALAAAFFIIALLIPGVVVAFGLATYWNTLTLVLVLAMLVIMVRSGKIIEAISRNNTRLRKKYESMLRKRKKEGSF